MNRDHTIATSVFRRCIISPYATLGLVGLLCHGVLLLCDYKIWDGWLVDNWQRNSRVEVMKRVYWEAGIQHHFLIHRALGGLPFSTWLYKALSFCSYLGIAWSFYFLTVRTKALTRKEALIASSLMLTFPGMMTLGEAAVFPYVLGLLLFFQGACCAIRAEANTGYRHILLRLAAISLFMAGFTYYATLVFYLAFYLLLLWFVWKADTSRSAVRLCSLAAQRIDYLLLPVVFWAFKARFMNPYGHYATYNLPGLNFEKLCTGYASLFSETLIFNLANFDINPLMGCLAFAVGLIIVNSGLLRSQTSVLRASWIFVVGFLLIVLAGFPFVSVGKSFAARGYGSNYSLFTPIGAGLILLSVLSLLHAAFRWDRKGILVTMIFTLLIASFICTWNGSYLHWQALGAKDRSVAQKLKQLAGASQYTIFHVKDEFLIPLTEEYPNVVRGVQLQDAFGDWTRFGFNVTWPLKFWNTDDEIGTPPPVEVGGLRLGSRSYTAVGPFAPQDFLRGTIEQTTIPYYFSEVVVGGPQALLVIRPGRAGDVPVSIALKYLGYRFLPFFETDSVNDFLDRLTEIMIYPVPAPRPSASNRYRNYLPAGEALHNILPGGLLQSTDRLLFF